ncbi:MAG: hypothetical protein H0W96_03345 [Solirubrobacterales bacterium]|nr:hypothetical protein [Solirubrobacterales bacterium]
MATISRNFTEIVVEPNSSTVKVTGTTELVHDDGTREPIAEDGDTQILVTIIGVPDESGPRVAFSNLSEGSTWPARFRNTAKMLGGCDSIRLIGLALNPNADPFVWQDVRMLKFEDPVDEEVDADRIDVTPPDE